MGSPIGRSMPMGLGGSGSGWPYSNNSMSPGLGGMGMGGGGGTDISQHQHPHQHQHPQQYHMATPPGSGMTGPPNASTAPGTVQNNLPNNLFDQANRLTESNRQILINFLSGQVMQAPDADAVRQILLNEEEKVNEVNGKYLEQIIFEINYSTGSWRKLRRKKILATEAK